MEETLFKILFLNPPHAQPMARRYMCSYLSPHYLLPPYDLVQLATCARQWNHAQVVVVDAIALKYSEGQTASIIAESSPDILIALTGIEIFGDDMACIDRMKLKFPSLELGIFGYYPTLFPQEVLQKSTVDFILRGEPEKPLSAYLEAKQKGCSVESVPGLAGRTNDGSLFVNAEERIVDLDSLPFPDYDLINLDLYEEAFFGQRCAALLSSRGCPFSCSYCTTTYGRKTIYKSPEVIVEEMKYLQEKGAQSIRFLDDTFTFNRERVMEICRQIISHRIQIPWSCAARTDTVDKEVLKWLKRAGCKRILVGVESYSSYVLTQLNKRIDPATINPQLQLIHEMGIQIVAHFVVGAPFETAEDFKLTLKGALASPLDFIIVNLLTPYAGTPYFEKVQEFIEFSLLPYKCEYKNPEYARIAKKRLNRLYARFYLRPVIIVRQFYYFIAHPLRAFKLLSTFLN